MYKYTSRSEKRAIYNGLRIEIQIRSKLQHLWATAVEIIDAYTYQSLKVGRGEKSWERFFALMSCHFADLERCPLVPGTPILSTDLVEELREICSNLNAIHIFRGYVRGLNVVEQNIPLPLLPSNMYILILDVEAKKTTVIGFDDLEAAAAEYIAREKDTIRDPAIQVVMVSGESVSALKKGYPNYYLDAEEFLDYVEQLTDTAAREL